MAWDVEYTDEFGSWWESLDEDEQAAVDASVSLLGIYGPALSRPHGGPPFCSSAGTRVGTAGGMTSLSLWRTGFMTST